jgi:hypothetical protein
MIQILIIIASFVLVLLYVMHRRSKRKKNEEIIISEFGVIRRDAKNIIRLFGYGKFADKTQEEIEIFVKEKIDLSNEKYTSSEFAREIYIEMNE